jgi:hypothetical protein
MIRLEFTSWPCVFYIHITFFRNWLTFFPWRKEQNVHLKLRSIYIRIYGVTAQKKVTIVHRLRSPSLAATTSPITYHPMVWCCRARVPKLKERLKRIWQFSVFGRSRQTWNGWHAGGCLGTCFQSRKYFIFNPFVNKNFWEKLIAYFPLIQHGTHIKRKN